MIMLLILLFTFLFAEEVVWKGKAVRIEVAPGGTVSVNVPCRIKNVFWFPKEYGSGKGTKNTAVFFVTTKDMSAGIICEEGRAYIFEIDVDYKEPVWDEKRMKWIEYESNKPKAVNLVIKDPYVEKEKERKIATEIHYKKEEILAHGKALMVGMVTGKQVEGYTVVYPKKPLIIERNNLRLELVKKYEGMLEGYIFKGTNVGKMSMCIHERDFSDKGTVYIYIDSYRKSPACERFILYPGDFFYLYIVRVPLPEEDVVRIPYLKEVRYEIEKNEKEKKKEVPSYGTLNLR